MSRNIQKERIVNLISCFVICIFDLNLFPYMFIMMIIIIFHDTLNYCQCFLFHCFLMALVDNKLELLDGVRPILATALTCYSLLYFNQNPLIVELFAT